MGLNLDPMLILYFAAGLVVLYLVGWFMLAPFKVLIKLIINAVVGAVVIVAINLLGGDMLHIPLNAISAFIVGVFGVPGVALMLVLMLIL